MLRDRNADIAGRDRREGDRAQDFEPGDEDMTAFVVLAHIGDFLEHARHRAALGRADAALAMRARDADHSHAMGFLSMAYSARPRPVIFFAPSRTAVLTSHSNAWSAVSSPCCTRTASIIASSSSLSWDCSRCIFGCSKVAYCCLGSGGRVGYA